MAQQPLPYQPPKRQYEPQVGKPMPAPVTEEPILLPPQEGLGALSARAGRNRPAQPPSLSAMAPGLTQTMEQYLPQAPAEMAPSLEALIQMFRGR